MSTRSHDQPAPALDPAELGQWTSAAARDEVLDAYQSRLESLGDRVLARRVPTRFGPTQVLLAGDASNPALVFVHGANGDAAQMAAAYGTWSDTHYCVFVDVPGEPNPSCSVRLPRADDSLASWMADVLEALELDRVAMLGMSGGAYVVLRSALGLHTRVQIEAVVGLVPEGFCEIHDIPEALPANAAAFVEAITGPESGFPQVILQLMTQSMRMSLAAVHDPIHVGPVFRAEEFEAFSTPVMILAAGRDRIFPGEALLERAREVLPHARTLLLPDANHIHLSLYRGPAIEQVRAFLAEHTVR